ncbi:hypothetical protein [Lysobacter gummosus]|uniref:hypothetical protein n=1 Tax=Lysobacter gummosus TaxID=262324 RepID=UPI003628E108
MRSMTVSGPAAARTPFLCERSSPPADFDCRAVPHAKTDAVRAAAQPFTHTT